MTIVAMPLFVFFFGLFIGSFLNVVILRMNTGRSVVTGRSKCPHCNKTLAWYELLPVFSFIALRGMCSKCKARISFQYPLVELVTALVFTILYTTVMLPGNFTSLAMLSFVFNCIIAAVLIVIFAYDMRHKIIPDMAVYTFILLAIASIVFKAFVLPGFHIGDAVFGGVALALPFFLLWYFSNGRLMGFGDVKFALGMGWLLGFAVGAAALLLSFWIGGIVGLILIALSKKYRMTSEIPFAPFLILGTFIAGVWGITLTSLVGIWI